MPIAFVQSLLQGGRKAGSTTTVVSGSVTVTAGNTIFVAFGGADVSGTYSVADNLGNTYALSGSAASGSGQMAARLFRADITTGGTLTTITVTHPTITATGAIAVEFSGCGTLNNSGTHNDGGSALATIDLYPGGTGATLNTQAQIVGNLWLGVGSYQGPVTNGFAASATGSDVAAAEPTPEQGTTGGSPSSNIGMGFLYYISTDTSAKRLAATILSARCAGAGSEINPAVTASTLLWKPRLGPNHRR